MYLLRNQAALDGRKFGCTTEPPRVIMTPLTTSSSSGSFGALASLSQNVVSVVSPQTYCFDSDPSHCRFANSNDLRVIKARGGSRILVDVPRQVATQPWTVTAASESTDNTFKALGVAGDDAEPAAAAGAAERRGVRR